MKHSSRRLGARLGTVFFVSAILSLILAPAARAVDPVVFVDASSAGNHEATSLTLPVPLGVGEGNLMLAQVTFEGGAGIGVTPPAGWELLVRDDNGTDIGQAIYKKFADAVEAPDYTWTLNKKKHVAGGIVAYDVLDPLTMVTNGSVGKGNGLTAPEIPEQDGPFIVSFFTQKKATTLSTPTNMTERYEIQSKPGDKPTSSANDEANPGPNEARTSTAGHNYQWVAQTILLSAGLDGDGDGIDDSGDNCLGLANPDQTDTDGDNAGDACDEDDDNDGFDDDEEDDTGPGNNQGSDPLDNNSVPEVCGDNVDNDGNEGIDEGCVTPPGKIFVDSSVTMLGDGTPFHGEVDSPRNRCKKNRRVQVKQRVTGPDEVLATTRSNQSFDWQKFIGAGLDGGFYAKISRKRYELADGTKVICKANRSRPLIRLPFD